MYFNINALELPLRLPNCTNACLTMTAYFGWALVAFVFLALLAAEPAFDFLPLLALGEAAAFDAEALLDVFAAEEDVPAV